MNLYRRLRHPRRLKQSAIMRWFARHFLVKQVWQPSRHTFAGGLAVGLFVMMILMPVQMFAALVIAAVLRLNIPIAAAVCWITNPFTFVPMIWWEIKLGNWLTGAAGLGTPPPLDWSQLKSMVHEAPGIWELFASMRPWASSVYLGGAATGLVLALVGYVLSFLLWETVVQFHQSRKAAVPTPTALTPV